MWDVRRNDILSNKSSTLRHRQPNGATSQLPFWRKFKDDKAMIAVDELNSLLVKKVSMVVVYKAAFYNLQRYFFVWSLLNTYFSKSVLLQAHFVVLYNYINILSIVTKKDLYFLHIFILDIFLKKKMNSLLLDSFMQTNNKEIRMILVLRFCARRFTCLSQYLPQRWNLHAKHVPRGQTFRYILNEQQYDPSWHSNSQ